VGKDVESENEAPRIGYDLEFRAKLAEDHSEIAKYNNYECGRRSEYGSMWAWST
jgi:hypothetical protein